MMRKVKKKEKKKGEEKGEVGDEKPKAHKRPAGCVDEAG